MSKHILISPQEAPDLLAIRELVHPHGRIGSGFLSQQQVRALGQ